MKKVFVLVALMFLAGGSLFLAGCPNDNNPNQPGNLPTNTPTSTSTPCGFPGNTCTPTVTNTPQVITVTIGSPGTSGGSYGSYYYTSPAGSSNNTNGLFTLACHVNDIINLPSGAPHTLWFDQGGSGTCITGFSGETSASMAYTFTSAGTYYFQCGVHGVCTGKASCSPTTCVGMAGVITVSP